MSTQVVQCSSCGEVMPQRSPGPVVLLLAHNKRVHKRSWVAVISDDDEDSPSQLRRKRRGTRLVEYLREHPGTTRHDARRLADRFRLSTDYTRSIIHAHVGGLRRRG